MNDDTQLVRQFAETASEQAFRELVERYIRLVNSTARRMAAGDVHLANDITQVVFTDLARKAASLPRGVVLGGWLYRHTCFITAKTIRGEVRRRARERTAMEITAANLVPAQDDHWQLLAPVLDDALNHLARRDRDAIVLRFLHDCDLRSIGRALGTSENAAQMRIARALEKLRALLLRRGITLSSAMLATSLDAGARSSVPFGLAAIVSAHAVNSAAAGTGLTLLSLTTMTTSKLVIATASLAALAIISAVTFSAIYRPSSPPPALAGSPFNGPLIAADKAAPALVPLTPDSIKAANPASPPAAASNNSMPLNTPMDVQSIALEGFPDVNDPNWMTKLTESEIFKATAGYGKELAVALIKYSADHDGNLPDETNLDSALAAYGADPQGPPFDLLYTNSLSSLKNRPQVVLLRQQQPVEAVDGRWVRTYVFADGHAELSNSADGNFTAWENEHTQPPSASSSAPPAPNVN